MVFYFFPVGLDVVAYWKNHYFVSVTLRTNFLRMAAGEVLRHP